MVLLHIKLFAFSPFSVNSTLSKLSNPAVEPYLYLSLFLRFCVLLWFWVVRAGVLPHVTYWVFSCSLFKFCCRCPCCHHLLTRNSSFGNLGLWWFHCRASTLSLLHFTFKQPLSTAAHCYTAMCCCMYYADRISKQIIYCIWALGLNKLLWSKYIVSEERKNSVGQGSWITYISLSSSSCTTQEEEEILQKYGLIKIIYWQYPDGEWGEE